MLMSLVRCPWIAIFDFAFSYSERIARLMPLLYPYLSFVKEILETNVTYITLI
jgi:hypothetical protein